MAAKFKRVFPKISLTSGKTPKTIDRRIEKLESDIRDLRSVVRELIEALERELARDLDRDHQIGHVSSGRGVPKTARLRNFALRPASRLERKPAPLPPNIP
jgi:hypothetical protein